MEQEQLVQAADTALQVNDIFLYFIIIAVIAGTGWFFHVQMKRNPNLKFGTLINKLIIENRESVFLLGAAAVNFFEAVVSASIHPVGQLPINSFARFGAHGVVAGVAIACAIYFAQYFKSWLDTFHLKGFDFNLFFVRFLLTLVSFIGMVIAPILNLFIVANGTQEIPNCKMLIMEIFYTDTYMQYWYETIEYPPNFDPYAAMSYVMAASVSMTLFHFILMTLDALSALDRKKGQHFNFAGDLDESKKYETLNKDINQRDEKQKESEKNDFPSSINFALMRYGYRKDQLKKSANLAKVNLDSMLDDQDKVKVSGLIAKICRDIRNWDANERKTLESKNDKAAVDKKNAEFNERIFSFFQAPIRGGNGLGMTLKKLNK